MKFQMLVSKTPSTKIFLDQTWVDRSTMDPKFDPAGVRTHDLQIMTAFTFHVTEMPALTTWPSVNKDNQSISMFLYSVRNNGYGS